MRANYVMSFWGEDPEDAIRHINKNIGKSVGSIGSRIVAVSSIQFVRDRDRDYRNAVWAIAVFLTEPLP